MKSRLTNTHTELIRLFAKIDDVEQQVDIPAGASILVDDYETRTIRVFKQRGFIAMEPYSLENQSDNVLKGKNEEQLLTEEKTAISDAMSRTIDEGTDPNNDEVMDHFHTTETQEIEEITDIEYVHKNLMESLQQPMMSSFEVVENEVHQYVEGGFVKGEWSEEDVEYLKKNYPTKGRKHCATHLNRNESSVQKKINSLGLKKKKKKKR